MGWMTVFASLAAGRGRGLQEQKNNAIVHCLRSIKNLQVVGRTHQDGHGASRASQRNIAVRAATMGEYIALLLASRQVN